MKEGGSMTLEESLKTIDYMSLFCVMNDLVPDKPYESLADYVEREHELIEAVLPDGVTMDNLKKHLGIE